MYYGQGGGNGEAYDDSLPIKSLSWNINLFSLWTLIPLAVCVAWLLIKLVNKQKNNKEFQYLCKSMKNGADAVEKKRRN